jgi:hypothetical protein
MCTRLMCSADHQREGSLTNQTNLAIKGIIGIKAASVIQGLLGNTAKASNYSVRAASITVIRTPLTHTQSIAASYVTKFQKLATSTTGAHLTLDYQDNGSWGIAYNLWSDKLLKLDLFPSSIYTEQTAWYKTVEQAYGIPLDTRFALLLLVLRPR